MTKEKRFQMVLLVCGTLGVLFAIWHVIIGSQQEGLKAKASKIVEVNEKIQVARRGVELAEQLKLDLEMSELRLRSVEESMATGDLYRWVINTMRRLQAGFQVEVTDFDPPEVGEFEELPRVPYQAATFSVIGTGRFQEFGQFLAEVENQLPFLYLRKVEMNSASGPTTEAAARETLTFHMLFQTLVRAGDGEALPGAGRGR